MLAGIAVFALFVGVMVWALGFWGIGVGRGMLAAGGILFVLSAGIAVYLKLSGASRAVSQSSYYSATGKLAVFLCLLAAGFGAAVAGVGGFLAWRSHGRLGHGRSTPIAMAATALPLDLARLLTLPDRTAAFEGSGIRAGRDEPDAVAAFAKGAPAPFRLDIAYRHMVVLPDGTRRGEHHQYFCDPRQVPPCIRIDTRRLFALEQGAGATVDEARFAERLWSGGDWEPR